MPQLRRQRSKELIYRVVGTATPREVGDANTPGRSLCSGPAESRSTWFGSTIGLSWTFQDRHRRGEGQDLRQGAGVRRARLLH